MELGKSKNKPLVSILITLFNQKSYFDRVLLSVVNQSYDNIEIIIGDDASDDGFTYINPTEGLHIKNIKYYKYPKNLGRKDNYRKLLFEYAKGDLATILNADDFFVNDNYISEVVELFLTNENISLVFGKTGVLIEKEKKTYFDSAPNNLPKVFDGNWLLLSQSSGFVIPHVSSVYRRDQALSLDFYNFPYYSEDWESLLCIIQGKKVGYVKEHSASYGRHQNNVSKYIDTQYLLKNSEYLDRPYILAKSLSQIPKRELNTWYSDMKKRYFAKCYLKILLWKPVLKNSFLFELKNYNPVEYNSLIRDYRFYILNLIYRSKLLLVFVFKYILRQEGVIRDFIAYGKSQRPI